MAGNFLGNGLCTLFGAGVFIAGCTVLLVIAFPVVQIAIGAVYMNECPVAPVIPVYVLVSGNGALLVLSLLTLPTVLCPARETGSLWTLWMLTLVLLYFIWFVYGSYHIYSVYPPNYTRNSTFPKDLTSPAAVSLFKVETQNQSLPHNSSIHTHTKRLQTHEPYCDRTLYLFAFWTTTLVYIFAAIALVNLICLFGFMKITEMFVEYLTR